MFAYTKLYIYVIVKNGYFYFQFNMEYMIIKLYIYKTLMIVRGQNF